VSLKYCRLEKQDAEASQQNLRLFDGNLAGSVASLERRGFVQSLLAAGGSQPFIMASCSTTPDVAVSNSASILLNHIPSLRQLFALMMALSMAQHNTPRSPFSFAVFHPSHR
jgi:hypothetical protein